MYRPILGVLPSTPLHAFRLSLEEFLDRDPETRGLEKRYTAGMNIFENTLKITSNYDIEDTEELIQIDEVFSGYEVNPAALTKAAEAVKAYMRADFQMGTDAPVKFKKLAKTSSLTTRTLINPLLLAGYLMQKEGRDRKKIPIERKPASFESAWDVRNITTDYGNGIGESVLDKGMMFGKVGYLWKIGDSICALHIQSDREITEFTLPVKIPETLLSALPGKSITNVFQFPDFIPADVLDGLENLRIKEIKILTNGYSFIFEKTRLIPYIPSNIESQNRLMNLAPVYL